MADNVTTQTGTPATLPGSVVLGAAEVSFSGQTVLVGLGAAADILGAEGSRVGSLLGRVKSGSVAVPLSSTAVTNFGGSTVYLLDVLLLCNTTANAITVGVLDGADASLFPAAFQVPGNDTRVIPLYGLEVTGAKWIASGAGVLGRLQGKTAI